LLDLCTHGLERDVEALQRLGGDALALVDQAEQDVLGADVVVGEHAGLFLGQHEHAAGSVSEPLEHANRSSTRVWGHPPAPNTGSHRTPRSGPPWASLVPTGLPAYVFPGSYTRRPPTANRRVAPRRLGRGRAATKTI